MSQSKKNTALNRRQFLKAGGAAGAVIGSTGLGFFGYQAGKDPETYTGWETYEGAHQTFPRKRFQIKSSPHEKVGPTRRPDARTEVIFQRRPLFMRQWSEEKGIEGLDDYLREYYEANPEHLELDLYSMREIMPKQRQDQQKYGDKYILSNAWSSAMGAVGPERINEPPEQSDFLRSRRTGERIERATFKDPKKTTKLIKKIAHELGATLVGVAELNPDWVYLYPMRGRGFPPNQPFEVPKHWKYAIVVGTPMSWDPLFANPIYGTSNDAYSRSRIIGFRLAAFLKRLGYGARPHTPGTDYDLMVPPIMVDAGLGEQSRPSIVITPELGCNIRPAVVTTDLPLVPDRPIKFGVTEFCRTCKICAENCPSGAISFGGKVEERGYLRYRLDTARCLNFWNSTLGNMGCRICVAVCPYTRKANWLHRSALNITANDPTGLSHKAMTIMQKRLYPGPDPQEYYIPSMGGSNATYRKPPWWMRTEDFIDL